MNPSIGGIAALAVLTLAAGAAAQTAVEFDVTYRPGAPHACACPDPDAPCNEPEPDTCRQVDGRTVCRMWARIWKPDGSGPWPAIVFNHGSSGPGGDRFFDLARHFADAGYVVFLPARRGHQISSTRKSCGENSVDYGDRHTGEELWRYFEKENEEEVESAIRYVKARPYVNPARVSVMGCSYGGIQSLIAATKEGLGLHAALPMAAASLSWGNHAIRSHMQTAAMQVRTPIYYTQSFLDNQGVPTSLLGPLSSAFTSEPAYGHVFIDPYSHGQFCDHAFEINSWDVNVKMFLSALIVF
jgi:dienelactone hydrolase